MLKFLKKYRKERMKRKEKVNEDVRKNKLLDSKSICVNIRFFAISLKINNQNML